MGCKHCREQEYQIESQREGIKKIEEEKIMPISQTGFFLENLEDSEVDVGLLHRSIQYKNKLLKDKGYAGHLATQEADRIPLESLQLQVDTYRISNTVLLSVSSKEEKKELQEMQNKHLYCVTQRIDKVAPRMTTLKDILQAQICIKKDSSLEVGSSSSIQPKISIMFDPSNLILENKSSITETYELLEIIGKGTFAEVRKVRHLVSRKIFALKIISKNCYKQCANIEREIEILKKLDHPNIVRLHEFSSDKENYYLVTDYCEGGSLFKQIVNCCRFTERIAARIMRMILSAVHYCHSKRIVHRDLKPENIVLETPSVSSNIKIIDFGTSKIFQPTEILQKLGTVCYMAPEVIQGKYSEMCDVWSCGVILYVMLSGFMPFGGNTNAEIVRNVLTEPIDLTGLIWGRISPGGLALLKRMMERDVKKRISVKEALNHPWILNGAVSPLNSEIILSGLIENLRQFESTCQLQKAVLSYIAANLISTEQERELREQFNMLDSDKDGRISKQELIETILKVNATDGAQAKKEAGEIMARIDLNKNGFIDYNEFLSANLKQADILNKDKLREDQVFNFFDFDKVGVISLDNVRHIFSAVPSEKDLEIIFKQVDVKKLGSITFEEFITAMSQIMKK